MIDINWGVPNLWLDLDNCLLSECIYRSSICYWFLFYNNVLISKTLFLSHHYELYPVLVVALEKVERSSGTLIGSSIATIQKSAAPEVIFIMNWSRSYG